MFSILVTFYIFQAKNNDKLWTKRSRREMLDKIIEKWVNVISTNFFIHKFNLHNVFHAESLAVTFGNRRLQLQYVVIALLGLVLCLATEWEKC